MVYRPSGDDYLLVEYGPQVLDIRLRFRAHALMLWLERAALRLNLLDPHLVLERGYAWLSDATGQAITRAAQTHPGQAVTATLMDGTVDLTVIGQKP